MDFKLFFSRTALLILIGYNVYGQPAGNSVFKSGKWYKIKVCEGGVYKITYEDLKNIGFESPENIRIYGNGGKQLGYVVSENDPYNPEEIAIYESRGNDNTFDPGDFYLFYGEGTVSWYLDNKTGLFRQKVHDYSLCNYYFITASFGSGKRISVSDFSQNQATKTVTSYSWREYHENELYNFTSSGRRWFGERFDEKAFTKSFSIDDFLAGSTLTVVTDMAVRSGSNKKALVNISGINPDTVGFQYVIIDNGDATMADVKSRTYKISPSGPEVSVSFSLYGASMNDRAYIDFINLNARCKLNFTSKPLFFRDIESVTEGAFARFRLSGANANVLVWDITDHNDVLLPKASLTSGFYEFVAPVSQLREYIAFDLKGSFLSPVYKDNELKDTGWINNQDILGMTAPELVIVTHPLFKKQADELAALHREKDNMDVAVVTTTEVYNEFSSGKPDASAIRNMARANYLKTDGPQKFKYLLLFGDGSFDNRTINDVNPNYIPTYQGENSTSPLATYTTDDFFGMLDVGEYKESGKLEIGVGRLPVNWDKNNTDKSAQGVVDKIKSYYNAESMKDWRNQVIFLADDGEHEGSPEFIRDSDSLTKIIERHAPSMNINKIYFDAYRQISSSTGASYPEVENELHRTLNKGALIFNYMGHGGENAISQEKVFQKSDFENLKNGPYYPLFVTATCQLSRFDNVIIASADNYSRKVSAGEAALLNPYGGGIALFTTTRVVYQGYNYSLSRDIFNMAFNKNENGNRYRLGDIFRLAKNNYTGDYVNMRKFALLGDPAITLAHGEFKVITDSVNNTTASEKTDTASALGSMRVCGYIADDDSTLIDQFNGIVQVSVYDKKYTVTTNGNDGITKMDFNMQDKLLFRGKASVVNGRFSIEFKIPKDITYSYGKGKISYYAQNGIIDAKGSFDNFYIGGTDQNALQDNSGPEIQLFMNNTGFRDGGITNNSPVLLAYISDENGINTTGIGIGHDISAVLNEDYSSQYTLNDYFEGNLNDFRSGMAYYQFNNLENGFHTIRVKAWDIYNNSSESDISFYVENKNSLVIEQLFCFPNPMKNQTSFQYSHNMPGEHRVTLKIHDLAGRQVYTYERTNPEPGFVSEPIQWQRKNGINPDVPPGVYIYTLQVEASTEYSSSVFESNQSGRLIIIPE
ncbi:MAG: type IX secretion system sortase PorU [Bacteroidales bacterium]|nr:type IX secretion system sortase PorU [Bacteroidales bacterium]